MERLSGMDAGFVYGETPSWHMHAGALGVLDPSTAPEGYDVHRLRALLEARKGLLAPFLRRIVPVPLGLDRPAWVSDPDLDIDPQFHRVAVPPPGGERELGALVGDLFAYKLERDRPPWEVWFIEGLEHGYVGILLKVHHSLLDGARAAGLYGLLFDLTPDAPLARPEVPETGGERIPPGWEMALRAVPRLAATPLRAARTAGHLGRAAVGVLRVRFTPQWATAAFPFQAPRTSLNHAITPHRAFAFCSLSLPEVKAVRHQFSATVNDVVLSVCGGALRRYLADRGELPRRPLIAMIPVAARTGGESGAGQSWGNAVAVMVAGLGTHIGDPVERLRSIHASTRSAKRMQQALGEEVILDIADVAPPGLLATVVRTYSRARLCEHHRPIFNLLVSNVAGPPVPLYQAGARLVANYPIGPLLDGGGLNVTVLSYLDRVDFGFTVCPEIVEDPWLLAGAAVEAFEELREAAGLASSQPAAHGTVA